MHPFRLLLSFPFSFFALSTAALAAPDSGGAPAPVLPSTVFDWAQLTVESTAAGERREIVRRPTATLEEFEAHATTLNPGRLSHEPHRHPQEELIVLREGTLEVSINGHVSRIGPGSVLFFASGDLHNVRNVGGGPATYLVFNFKTAATRAFASGAPVPSADSRRRGSCALNWDDLPVEARRVGQRRELFNGPTATLENFEGHVTTVPGGVGAHAAHRHPDEELLVVKSGWVDVTIEGKTQRVGPGSVCFFASNRLHGLRAAEGGPATYYALRLVTAATPKPGTPERG